MVDLKEKTPCAGLLPLTVGNVTLEELAPGPMASISPFGTEASFSKTLEKAHGMTFPAPNRTTGREGARAVWFGRNEALLIGTEPSKTLSKSAAVVDQSDAWAVVKLSGEGATDVLARLVPLDLRDAAFKRGHTARSQLMHMSASITKLGSDQFMIFVFRSMAGTLVHDLKAAMAAVAARG